MNRSRLAVFLLTMLAGVELHAGGSLPDRKAPDFDVAAPLWESGQYAYDGAGNIITIGDDAYDYDLAGRVTAGTAHTKTHANSQTFEYDVYGNLKTIQTKSDLRPATNAPWVARPLTIDSATNRVLKPCGPAAGCSNLGYDPAGNVTSDGPATSSWDLLGNMQQLTTAGRKERYLYDASNERIATITVDTAAPAHEYRRYTIRGANQKVLREATDEVTGTVHSWKWDKDYVHRDGALIASIVPTDAAATVEETSHFHLDHLGSARVTTDGNGYRRSMNTYYPFGEEAPGSDFNRERMRFTGHERDFGATPAEDLDYMHARYYRAVWGRFTAADRVLGEQKLPQTFNRYAYTANNPINAIDPTGLWTFSISVTFTTNPGVTPGAYDKISLNFDGKGNISLTTPWAYGTGAPNASAMLSAGWTPSETVHDLVTPEGGKPQINFTAGSAMLMHGVNSSVGFTQDGQFAGFEVGLGESTPGMQVGAFFEKTPEPVWSFSMTDATDALKDAILVHLTDQFMVDAGVEGSIGAPVRTVDNVDGCQWAGIDCDK